MEMPVELTTQIKEASWPMLLRIERNIRVGDCEDILAVDVPVDLLSASWVQQIVEIINALGELRHD